MASTRDRIIWGNVARILQKRGMSLADLAKAMNITPQSVNSIKSGVRGIGARTIKKLAVALAVDEIHLLSIEPPARHPRAIPVISWVQAGALAEAVDLHAAGVSGEGDPAFSTKNHGPHAFGLRVEGDSMAPRFLPGDIIVVDPDIRCENGCPCVVVLNGEATFKIFRETAEAISLEPMNKKYPEIIVRKDREVDFRVVGKVVDLIPKM